MKYWEVIRIGTDAEMRKNLRQARKEKGLTQQKMADLLGISLRYYQQIEAGDIFCCVKWRAIRTSRNLVLNIYFPPMLLTTF